MPAPLPGLGRSTPPTPEHGGLSLRCPNRSPGVDEGSEGPCRTPGDAAAIFIIDCTGQALGLVLT